MSIFSKLRHLKIGRLLGHVAKIGVHFTPFGRAAELFGVYQGLHKKLFTHRKFLKIRKHKQRHHRLHRFRPGIMHRRILRRRGMVS